MQGRRNNMEKAEGTVKNPETELAGAQIRDNVEPHNEGVTFEPLFANEGVTEAQLKGEDATGDKTATPEPKSDDTEKKGEETPEAKKAAEEKSEADAKVTEAKAKEDAEKAKAEIPADVKAEVAKKDEHIAGLTTAVTQERQAVKRLKQEVQRLSAENQQLKTPKAGPDEADKFKDFKVLSPEEYDALVDEDPDAAVRYSYKYNLYREHKTEIERRKTIENQVKAAETEIVNYGFQELEKVLPGVTQGKNDMAGVLTNFAVQNGISDSVLAILTHPGTKVTTIEGENLLMGEGAAQLVHLIKASYEKVSSVPDRKKIEAELRPIIESEVQTKIIEKLKQDPSGGFRSLDQLAGSGKKDSKPILGTFSESDYAQMTEAEQRAALGG